MRKIVIIWWTSWFWKWTAWFIKKEFPENEILITWRNTEKWEKASKETWTKFSTENISEVKNADIVIFCLPISKTESAIKEIWPHINPKAVVLDVTSIKWFPAKAMKQYCPKTCTIIPTHPMFWPYVSSIASQVFVLCPDSETEKTIEYIFLKNFLSEKWSHIIEVDPEEHDRMMAVVQWLTHFSLFTIWETIRRLWIDVEFSQKFVSPIYKILSSSVSRYVSQDPWLYADIQMNNEEVLKVHKTFMEVRNDFSKFVQEKDKKSFIETIEKTGKHFWKTAVEWQQYTDKIIFLLSKQTENIKAKIWKKAEFENIYTREKLKWKIEEFNQKTRKVYLDIWEVISTNEWVIL